MTQAITLSLRAPYSSLALQYTQKSYVDSLSSLSVVINIASGQEQTYPFCPCSKEPKPTESLAPPLKPQNSNGFGAETDRILGPNSCSPNIVYDPSNNEFLSE